MMKRSSIMMTVRQIIGNKQKPPSTTAITQKFQQSGQPAQTTATGVLLSYVHITRVVIDQLRLTLPCGWQFQKYFEEAYTQNHFHRPQSALLIQKQLFLPQIQQQYRHHSNKALHSATSLTNNLVKNSSFVNILAPQHSAHLQFQDQQKCLIQNLGVGNASSNSCSVTPPAVGGSQSPVSNFGALNFKDAEMKILKINQQIKQIETASAKHALLFHRQALTPVYQGIKLTHNFPVQKATNNILSIGKGFLQEVHSGELRLEGSKTPPCSQNLNMRGEEEDSIWEIGPGRNQTALKLNPSKFQRNLSPTKGSLKIQEGVGKFGRSRFAPEIKNRAPAGKSEISQLNEQDFHEDNSIMSSPIHSATDALGVGCGPLKQKLGWNQRPEEDRKSIGYVGTPTSKFVNKLSINMAKVPRAHSPFSQRYQQPALLKPTDQGYYCDGNYSPQVPLNEEISYENKDPIIPAHLTLQPFGHSKPFLGVQMSRGYDISSVGDNADYIQHDEEDFQPNQVKEREYQEQFVDDESWEEALKQAIDEGINFSQSSSVDEDYDVGDEIQEEKNMKVHPPTFNGSGIGKNSYNQDDCNNVYEPKKIDFKSNFVKFRQQGQCQRGKQYSMPMDTLVPPSQHQ
ncbi:hypothetical protein FGO68_gene14178 [Halteria grandinella]|uniref:Uncharacterized protein n=1 Tax=Halteria grandinella TaxID=5974 RepID=A0A8J8P5X3_HALGN|nr:hypothetical protein FGO68_gene14178 [Halteria grandinella]